MTCNAPYSDIISIQFNQFSGYAVTCRLYTTPAYYTASTKTVMLITTTTIIIIIGKIDKTLIYTLGWYVSVFSRVLQNELVVYCLLFVFLALQPIVVVFSTAR
jgi:hypothetical protein